MKGVSAAAEQNLSVTELPNMSVQRVPCLSVRQTCTCWRILYSAHSPLDLEISPVYERHHHACSACGAGQLCLVVA